MYLLSPSPSKATKETTHAFWHGGFTEAELNNIIELGDSLPSNNSIISGGELAPTIRNSKNAWVHHTPQTNYIYDRLAYICRQLNGEFFDFDLGGFYESLQFTVYDGEGSHYDWHLDKMLSDLPPRKLSLVMLLSGPSEFEGGDLELFNSATPVKVEKKKGLITAFPSFTLHRVTPVTSGIRKSLVAWVGGPKFR